MSLFLKACGANPGFVMSFMDFLSKNRHMVELINVLDALQDFEDSGPENKAEAKELKSNVINSGWTTHHIFFKILETI